MGKNKYYQSAMLDRISVTIFLTKPKESCYLDSLVNA